MGKRSLYQCYQAKCRGNEIRCGEGLRISHTTRGTIPVEKLAKGEPLEPEVCQTCPVYDHMGPPVPAAQRGWESGNPPETPDGTIPITELNVSTGTMNTLRRRGIETIGQLVQKDPGDLLKIRNFGKARLAEVLDAIENLEGR